MGKYQVNCRGNVKCGRHKVRTVEHPGLGDVYSLDFPNKEGQMVNVVALAGDLAAMAYTPDELNDLANYDRYIAYLEDEQKKASVVASTGTDYTPSSPPVTVPLEAPTVSSDEGPVGVVPEPVEVIPEVPQGPANEPGEVVQDQVVVEPLPEPVQDTPPEAPNPVQDEAQPEPVQEVPPVPESLPEVAPGPSSEPVEPAPTVGPEPVDVAPEPVVTQEVVVTPPVEVVEEVVPQAQPEHHELTPEESVKLVKDMLASGKTVEQVAQELGASLEVVQQLASA